MKKILFLIHDLAQGGAEKVLVNLVNNMDRNTFDITVVTLFDVGVNKQFLKEHIHYKSCFKHMIRGNSHFMKLLSPTQLYKWLIKDQYDIVVSYLEGPSARVISGCPYSDSKLVSWIHVEQHTLKNASKAFRGFSEAKKSYEKFDRIVCVSQTVKEDFQSIFHLTKPIQVLYNTNETAQIKKLAEEMTDIIDSSKFNICGVGKLIPIKGFERLLKIHKRLLNEGYLVHTYILGEGREREKLQAYVDKNHLTKSVTFLGYQINPYKYVGKCDLFVCTSYAEGFSTAATEALIVGTPVCTTEVSGMKEMLGNHDEYGVVVENNDEALYKAVKKFVVDSNYLAHYKKMAKYRGQKFSTNNTVEAVENMFCAL